MNMKKKKLHPYNDLKCEGYVNVYAGIHAPYVSSKVYETLEQATLVGKCFSYYLTTISINTFKHFWGREIK
jgi:hypothetical protein